MKDFFVEEQNKTRIFEFFLNKKEYPHHILVHLQYIFLLHYQYHFLFGHMISKNRYDFHKYLFHHKDF